ncbi:MAG: hypothetical protein ACFE94_01020 [Candidatus Hodarchaeota archaeon]
MVEENNFSSEEESDVESELYALVNTILNAYEKYKNGVIKEHFFHKKVKNTINELLKFNMYLDENDIDLSVLLRKMNFTNQYFTAIDIINKISALEFPHVLSERDGIEQSRPTKTLSSTVLGLPAITLEITSSFITLMDALKLKGFQEIELIDNLFKDLIKSLKKFPGMDKLSAKIKTIHNNTLTKLHNTDNATRLMEEIVDDLYQIFLKFQNKINLKA